jgi:putative resolvase
MKSLENYRWMEYLSSMKLSQYAKKGGVTYRTAKGDQVTRTVKEFGSGLNDHRPKFLALLTDQSITHIVVEQKDRATRFGFRYVETFLQMQERQLEVVHLAETSREDLLADFTSVIDRVCAKLSGQRRAKHKAEQIVKQGGETCGSSNNI